MGTKVVGEVKKGLTPEILREFKGFENVNDEEAERIIYSIKELTVVIYQYHLTNKKS